MRQLSTLNYIASSLFRYFAQADRMFWWIFIPLLLWLYPGMLHQAPLNVHIWRQADCLSLTQQYYEGAPLLAPQMHMQMGDGFSSGRTAGEFPGFYYFMAQIWKLTGMQYWSYRLPMLLLMVLAIWSFYKSLSLLLGKRWLVLSITFMLLASPTFLFYGVSFLTDAPAFCLVLLALSSILQHHRTGKWGWFWLAMGLFLAAGLIKISSLIAFAFLLGICILELVGLSTLGLRKLFAKPGLQLLGFTAVMAGVYAWYSYAQHYNNSHGFKYTYNDIFPIWQLEGDAWRTWLKSIWNETLLVYFPYPTVFLMGLIWLFNLLHFKQLSLFAWLANGVVVLGGALYVALWGPLFAAHDYYYIALLILFPAIVVPFAWLIDHCYSNQWSVKRQQLVRTLWLVYAAYSLLYGIQMMQVKTTSYVWGKAPITVPQSFYNLMHWFNWYRDTHWQSYARLASHWDAIGVGSKEKVISMADPSFNISLYLMQRKGWTNYPNFENPETLEKAMQNGASILVVADTAWLSKPILQPLLTHPIDTFEQLYIFRIRP